MSARTATAPKTPAKAQRELEDLQLVLKARNGSTVALDSLIRRYTPFVRLKASAYFLVGGGNDDQIANKFVVDRLKLYSSAVLPAGISQP